MSARLPFDLYAQVYDALYQDKDYAAEAGFVASLLQRFLPRAAQAARIVDLACGTGRHAFELARRGFALTGCDLSAPMIEVARGEAARRGLDMAFHVESLQSCGRLPGPFDVALSMFASIGYLVERAELGAMLRNVRSLLPPGGLFILDVWNGLAVLRDYSPLREKTAQLGRTRVRRVSTTTLDEVKQVARVMFRFTLSTEDGATQEFSEEHRVRFFFPQELADRLQDNGFELLLLCPFMEASRPLAPHDWNMTFVARRA